MHKISCWVDIILALVDWCLTEVKPTYPRVFCLESQPPGLGSPPHYRYSCLQELLKHMVTYEFFLFDHFSLTVNWTDFVIVSHWFLMGYNHALKYKVMKTG